MITAETKQELITRLEKPYYSIYETAEIVGVHHKTIRNHINDGTLRAGKSGTQWRIAKEDIINYVKNAGATTGIRKDIALTKEEILKLKFLVYTDLQSKTQLLDADEGKKQDKELVMLERLLKKLDKAL